MKLQIPSPDLFR